MKTSLKVASLFVCLMLQYRVSVGQVDPACPFNLDNPLGCAITYSIEMHEDPGTGCVTCNGTAATFSVSVPANGGQVQLSCSDFTTKCKLGTVCGFRAWVFVGATQVAGPYSYGSGSVALNQASFPSGCNVSAGVNIDSSMNVLIINP